MLCKIVRKLEVNQSSEELDTLDMTMVNVLIQMLTSGKIAKLSMFRCEKCLSMTVSCRLNGCSEFG